MSELFAKRTGIGFVLKVVGLVVIAWGIVLFSGISQEMN